MAHIRSKASGNNGQTDQTAAHPIDTNRVETTEIPSLNIFLRSDEALISLNRAFQKHLQLSVSGESAPSALFRNQIARLFRGVMHTDVANAVLSYLPTEHELIAFANERWEVNLSTALNSIELPSSRPCCYI